MRIWYSGDRASYKGMIGYATSANGINWTKHENPVLETGASGSWEEFLIALVQY